MRFAFVVAFVASVTSAACDGGSTGCDDAASCDAQRTDGSRPAIDATNDVAAAADAIEDDAVAPVDSQPLNKFDCADDPSLCGSNARCDASFPRGLCTRSCTSDRDCFGGAGLCDPTYGCLPTCVAHSGADCDGYGGACFPRDATATQFFCRPSCFPPGTSPPFLFNNRCGGGTTCDPNTLRCATTLSTGALVGESCTRDEDCATRHCHTEVDGSGAPTGFLGGQCYAIGRLPDWTEYRMDMPIPRANCPEHSVAIPYAREDGEGDAALCLASCVVDADCARAGYRCEQFVPSGGTAPFTNGVCVPLNCADPAQPCPSGTHCVTAASDASMPTGVCASGAPVDDAGTDAADVTSDDVVAD